MTTTYDPIARGEELGECSRKVAENKAEMIKQDKLAANLIEEAAKQSPEDQAAFLNASGLKESRIDELKSIFAGRQTYAEQKQKNLERQRRKRGQPPTGTLPKPKAKPEPVTSPVTGKGNSKDKAKAELDGLKAICDRLGFTVAVYSHGPLTFRVCDESGAPLITNNGQSVERWLIERETKVSAATGNNVDPEASAAAVGEAYETEGVTLAEAAAKAAAPEPQMVEDAPPVQPEAAPNLEEIAWFAVTAAFEVMDNKQRTAFLDRTRKLHVKLCKVTA